MLFMYKGFVDYIYTLRCYGVPATSPLIAPAGSVHDGAVAPCCDINVGEGGWRGYAAVAFRARLLAGSAANL